MDNYICACYVPSIESTFKKYDLVEGTKVKKLKSSCLVLGAMMAGAGCFIGLAVVIAFAVQPYTILIAGLIGAISGGSLSSLSLFLHNKSLKSRCIEKIGADIYNEIKNKWEQGSSKITSLNKQVENHEKTIKDLKPGLPKEQEEQRKLAKQKYQEDLKIYNEEFNKMSLELRVCCNSIIEGIQLKRIEQTRINNPRALFSPTSFVSPIEIQYSGIISDFISNRNNSYSAKENLILQLMQTIEQIDPAIGGNNFVSSSNISNSLYEVLNRYPEPPKIKVKKGNIEKSIDSLNDEIERFKLDIVGITKYLKKIEKTYNITNNKFPDNDKILELMPK